MHHVVATLLVVLVGRLAAAQESANLLFNFGAIVGDTEVTTEDDGHSYPIDITTSNFVFFGQSFSSLYVSCTFFLQLLAVWCFSASSCCCIVV